MKNIPLCRQPDLFSHFSQLPVPIYSLALLGFASASPTRPMNQALPKLSPPRGGTGAVGAQSHEPEAEASCFSAQLLWWHRAGTPLPWEQGKDQVPTPKLQQGESRDLPGQPPSAWLQITQVWGSR